MATFKTVGRTSWPHHMINGELKSKVDGVWNALRWGGIANPLTAIGQITYLLFLRRLDELHTLEEDQAHRTGKPMARHILPEGNDDRGTPSRASGGQRSRTRP